MLAACDAGARAPYEVILADVDGATADWSLLDDLAALRAALVAKHPHLARIDEVAANDWQPLAVKAPAKATFRPVIREFYLTNPIARASALMGELSAMAAERARVAMAAE